MPNTLDKIVEKFNSFFPRKRTILLFLVLALIFQFFIGVTALFNSMSITETDKTLDFSGPELKADYFFNLNLQSGGIYKELSEINIKLAFQVNGEEVKGIQIKYDHNFTIKSNGQNFNFIGEEESKVSLQVAPLQSNIEGLINLTNSEALENIKDTITVKVSLKAFTKVWWNDLGDINLIDLAYAVVVLCIFISFKALIEYDKKFTNLIKFIVVPIYIVEMILIFSRKIIESGVRLGLFTLYEMILYLILPVVSLFLLLILLIPSMRTRIKLFEAGTPATKPSTNKISLFSEFLKEIESIQSKPRGFKIINDNLRAELNNLKEQYRDYLSSLGIWLENTTFDPELNTFYYQPAQIKSERIRSLEQNPLLKLSLYLITISSINPLAFVLKFFSGIS